MQRLCPAIQEAIMKGTYHEPLFFKVALIACMYSQLADQVICLWQILSIYIRNFQLTFKVIAKTSSELRCLIVN